jgi:hypothetical protein
MSLKPQFTERAVRIMNLARNSSATLEELSEATGVKVTEANRANAFFAIGALAMTYSQLGKAEDESTS